VRWNIQNVGDDKAQSRSASVAGWSRRWWRDHQAGCHGPSDVCRRHFSPQLFGRPREAHRYANAIWIVEMATCRVDDTFYDRINIKDKFVSACDEFQNQVAGV